MCVEQTGLQADMLSTRLVSVLADGEVDCQASRSDDKWTDEWKLEEHGSRIDRWIVMQADRELAFGWVGWLGSELVDGQMDMARFFGWASKCMD